MPVGVRGRKRKEASRGGSSKGNTVPEDWSWVMGRVEGEGIRLSEMALCHYNMTHNAHFKLVQRLHCEVMRLKPPGPFARGRSEEWCHLSFIARQNNGDREDTHTFFAELLKRECEFAFTVQHCSRFNPGDGEFDSGCIVCPPVLLHPRKANFVAGTSEYKPVGWRFD